MFKTLINAFKNKDIRFKIWMTLLLLLVYRIGCYTPIPGLDASAIQSSVTSTDSLMGVMSAITGGALSNGTFLALGIVPFINASIIMQLLTIVIPKLERLSKEGDDGRKKINAITRIVAIGLGALQAVGVVSSWSGHIDATFGSTLITTIAIVIILVAGSAFAMWLGERITEYGIGNGTSLLIFIGIIATAGNSIWGSFEAIAEDYTQIWNLILFLALVIVIFAFIVWLDLSERKIPVQYAKQVKGNKMYGGQSTHIPIKVIGGGVLPIIFASALLMFPQMIASLFGTDTGFYIWWSTYIGAGTWVYFILFAILIVAFTFFYSQIQFNPDDVAKNIQQYGGFVPGIRPGKPTADYLKKINNRITMFGAFFLAIIALVPSIIFSLVGGNLGLTNAFSATGMMIIVSVALEFNKQLEAQLMMRHYRGFLK
ncbi:MAG: preprotein translocase subunit SecY [Christensenellales bacterium]